MKVGGPDWEQIRADTRRGAARFWPLLLVFGLVSLTVGAVIDQLTGAEGALAPGLPGYVHYLWVCIVGLVPFALIAALSSAMVINGMAGRPVGPEAISRRAVRALPTVIVSSAIFLAPWWISGLITYANVDGGTWWLARAGGVVATAALMSILGFIDFEAIARGLGPTAAIRASVDLTRGSRTWLAWLYLGIEVAFEIIRTALAPFDELARQGGGAWLGVSPVTDGLFALLWLVMLPFAVAVYLELRRLQDGEALGLATFD